MSGDRSPRARRGRRGTSRPRRVERLAFVVLALIAGCASAPRGDEVAGVSTRLEALESEHRVGQPMRFRLSVLWSGDGPASIDTQDAARPEHIRVTGPDGPLVYHGWRGSTMRMGRESLEPGEERVITDGADILQSYTIDKPGRYRVQFEGASSAFGVIAFPPSNTVEIDVVR